MSLLFFNPYVLGPTFSNFLFTTMGTTGRTGPTTVTYSPTPLGWGGLSGGMQLWTVPTTGSYRIIAGGAGSPMTVGSQTAGGRGAVVSTTVTLTAGHVIRLLVGQGGKPGTNGTYPQFGSGGGGGSFVYNNTTSSLILVGGGGGNPFNITSGTGGDANTTTNGANGNAGGTGGTNGAAGSNNQMNNDPNPGAGYSGNVLYTGSNPSVEPALSFLNATNPGRGSKAADANGPEGGFGGGGGIGGGGGYSGGGGINFGQSGWGGGGGSYDVNGVSNAATRYTGTLPAGVTTVTTPGYNNGAGFIYIEKL